jgi:hypothetical protein
VTPEPEPWYFAWYTTLHREAATQEVKASLEAMGYREK